MFKYGSGQLPDALNICEIELRNGRHFDVVRLEENV